MRVHIPEPLPHYYRVFTPAPYLYREIFPDDPPQQVAIIETVYQMKRMVTSAGKFIWVACAPEIDDPTEALICGYRDHRKKR